MKKLLIFMLVLGLASMTHGAIVQLAADDVTDGQGTGGSAQEVTVTEGGDVTVEVSVYSSNTDAWKRYFQVSDESGIGSFSALTALTAAGDDKVLTDNPYGYAGYWHLEAKDTSSPFNIAAGEQFNFTYTASDFAADGSIVQTITLYNEAWSASIDVLKIVQVIPEPITIALLGLGGLFLRRRK